MNYRLVKIFCISALSFLTSCNKDNNVIYENFEKEFQDSISKNNAQKFDYAYDGLVPQKSWFTGSKLKYLYYRHGPENGSVESLVYFDLKTDSLLKIIRRKIYYEWNDAKNVRTGDFTDTLQSIIFNPRRVDTYVDNNQVDLIPENDIFDDDRDFMYEIKKATEKAHNQ